MPSRIAPPIASRSLTCIAAAALISMTMSRVVSSAGIPVLGNDASPPNVFHTPKPSVNRLGRSSSLNRPTIPRLGTGERMVASCFAPTVPDASMGVYSRGP
jgi:hypothetical protein